MIFKKLLDSSGFKKYLRNTFWVSLTQGVRLLAGFFVGLWIANYMGPAIFGEYNYVLSYITIFLAFSVFGTGDTMTKILIEHEDDYLKVLNAGFYLRLISGIVSLLFLVLVLHFNISHSDVKIYIYISSVVLILQSFELIDMFFYARSETKTSSVAKIYQISISSILKIVCIVNQADVINFYYIFIFDYVSYAFLLVRAFLKNNLHFFKLDLLNRYIKKIFYISWPMMVVAVGNSIFNRYDQIVLGNVNGSESVGIYSASKKILELAALYPAILSISLMPAIIKAKLVIKDTSLYLDRFKKFSALLIFGSLLISVILFVFAEHIILLLFSDKYLDAKNVLKIISLALVFTSMSFVSVNWYVIENKQKILLLKVVLMAVFNVVCLHIFVPAYGLNGAATVLVLSYFLFFFLFELFFKQTRECFYINCSFVNIFKIWKR